MSALVEHFRFLHPVWLLLLIPATALIILRRGRGAASAVVFPNLSVLVSLGKRARHTASSCGIPLVYFSLFLAILGLARPVWRNEYQNRTTSGIDIVIAFDVSLSMEIDDFTHKGRKAERIDVAKMVVDDFITRRPEDRIGLVAFAGRPRDASPITLDHKWLRSSLKGLEMTRRNYLGTVKEPGTAIGSAIAASATRLDGRESKSKVIVLITDGASNSGKISPIEAAEYAKTLGIRIYTIAIGTVEGRVDTSVMRYPYQEFDLPTLRKISSKTGGEHFWAQDLESLRDTFATINDLEKTEAKSFPVIEDTELFPWFIASALLLGLIASIALALTPPTVA